MCKNTFCTRVCFGLYFSKNYVKEKATRWLGGKVESVCKQCQKPFLQDLHQVGKRLLCSRACSSEYRKQYAGERASNWQGGKISRNCLICSKEYKIGRSILKRTGRGKYCSRTCKDKAVSLQAPESHWNWKGGVPRQGYPAAFNNPLRRKIRERDGFICQGCGQTEEREKKERNRVLQVHHIDSYKNNLDEKNLITTCILCNQKAKKDKEVWQAYYLSKIQ